MLCIQRTVTFHLKQCIEKCTLGHKPTLCCLRRTSFSSHQSSKPSFVAFMKDILHLEEEMSAIQESGEAMSALHHAHEQSNLKRESTYTNMAPYYDEIFPDRQRFSEQFLCRYLKYPRSDVLDVGCATGGVVLPMAAKGHTCTGMDLDPDLLAIARSKMNARHNLGEECEVTWLQGDMCDVGSLFHPHSFDLITCVGNTLPHLASAELIAAFIADCHALLKPKGTLIVQTLNYAAMQQGRAHTLPLIATPRCSLARRYCVSGGRAVFETDLTVGSEVVSAAAQHTPVTDAALHGWLGAAGFSDQAHLGSAAGEAVADDSSHIIVVATK